MNVPAQVSEVTPGARGRTQGRIGQWSGGHSVFGGRTSKDQQKQIQGEAPETRTSRGFVDSAQNNHCKIKSKLQVFQWYTRKVGMLCYLNNCDNLKLAVYQIQHYIIGWDKGSSSRRCLPLSNQLPPRLLPKHLHTFGWLTWGLSGAAISIPISWSVWAFNSPKLLIQRVLPALTATPSSKNRRTPNTTGVCPSFHKKSTMLGHCFWKDPFPNTKQLLVHFHVLLERGYGLFQHPCSFFIPFQRIQTGGLMCLMRDL